MGRDGGEEGLTWGRVWGMWESRGLDEEKDGLPYELHTYFCSREQYDII